MVISALVSKSKVIFPFFKNESGIPLIAGAALKTCCRKYLCPMDVVSV